MPNKKDYFYSVVICYVILVMLFFSLKSRRNTDYLCEYDSLCVKFCCWNKTTCNENFIRKNFKIPEMPADVSYNEKKEYKDLKILYGDPYCDLKPNEMKIDWKSVSYYFHA